MTPAIKKATDARGDIAWSTDPRWCRFYLLSRAKMNTVRDEHANREATRLYYCVVGSVQVAMAAPGCASFFHTLGKGMWLVVPPMHWTRLTRWRKGTTLLCMADKPYAPEDMIFWRRDWEAECRSAANAGRFVLGTERWPGQKSTRARVASSVGGG